MKVCSECSRELAKDAFSKKQWQAKRSQRRCKECTGTGAAARQTSGKNGNGKGTPGDAPIVGERPQQTTETRSYWWHKLPRRDSPTNPPAAASAVDGPPRVSCFICLGEEPDESGRLPTRDCLCRGENAGYAHLECLKLYAQKSCMDALSGNSGNLTISEATSRFSAPFKKCNLCKGEFQHDLANEMADALLRCVEEKFGEGDPLHMYLYLEAMQVKLNALVTMHLNSADAVAEGKQVGQTLLLYARRHSQQGFEALAHGFLGQFFSTCETYPVSIMHYRKARKIYKSLGQVTNVNMMDVNVSRTRMEFEGRKESAVDSLQQAQELYDFSVESHGEHSIAAVRAGMNLSLWLKEAGCGIEGEIRAFQMMSTAIRVLGEKHDTTQAAAQQYAATLARKVTIQDDSEGTMYQALNYDGSRDEYTIRKVGDGMDETLTVAGEKVFFGDGTPVICHGLKSAQHLNGKVGDARSYDSDADRYAVFLFGDAVAEPVRVKRSNLRIVFDVVGEWKYAGKADNEDSQSS